MTACPKCDHPPAMVTLDWPPATDRGFLRYRCASGHGWAEPTTAPKLLAAEIDEILRGMAARPISPAERESLRRVRGRIDEAIQRAQRTGSRIDQLLEDPPAGGASHRGVGGPEGPGR